MEKISITIDGRTFQTDNGTFILEVCRAHKIDVPTFCYHEALEPRGACRLCQVEVSHPKWPGWKKLVVSCVYPAEDGLVVRTSTPEIEDVRRTLVDLLLARCPETQAVKDLGRKYGLERSTFRERADDDKCILCGLCVRVCEDVIGACAIGMTSRGATKVVAPPFGNKAEKCIGCAACASVCPTGCIEVKDEGMSRSIPRWNVAFTMVPCRQCGKPVSTSDHIEFVRRRVAVGPEVLETCPECLNAFYGRKVAVEGHM